MLNIKQSEKYFAGKTFADLFCGMGGFHVALRSLGAKCVWACDNDKYACKTYEQNFGINPFADITKVNASEVPDHDILCAGFPCTAFSIAGKKEGFENLTHGTLFFDVARIIKEKRPEIVLLENVKNFVGHDGGRSLKTVETTMNDLGYSFHYKVLSAEQYGASTKRERVYMVCFRLDLNVCGFSFPLPTGTAKRVRDILLPCNDPQLDSCWVNRSDITWVREDVKRSDEVVRLGIVADGAQGYRIYSINGIGTTLSATGGGVFPKTGGYLINGKIRSLAPREAARMMGFRDSFKLHSRPSQALKQCGNSVVVDVVQLIALEAGRSYKSRSIVVDRPSLLLDNAA